MIRTRLLFTLLCFSTLVSATGQSTGSSATTVTLTANPGSTVYGTTNAFTAVVNPSQGTSSPTGSVAFMDGTATLGTVQLERLVNSPVVTSGTQPNGGAVFADVNNDGKPDLIGLNWSPAAPSSGTTTVLVELGVGNGSFGQAIQYPTPLQGICAIGGVGDLNGDGKADLLIVNLSNNSIEYLPGNGDGTFGNPIVIYQDTNNLYAAALADVNGDHLLDVVAIDSESQPVGYFGSASALTFVNQGSGKFSSPAIYSIVGEGIAWGLAVADLNGDGYPDLLITLTDQADSGLINPYTVVGLLNQGNGTFGAAQSVFSGGTGSINLVIADFNQDKIPDLGILTSPIEGNAFTLSILLGNGDGTFGTPNTTQLIPGALSAFPEVQGLFAGDVNGDGKVDLVTGAYVLPGNGNGTFGTPYTFYNPSFIAGMNVQLVGVDDVTGDGIDDIAVLTGSPASPVPFNALNIFLGSLASQANFSTAALPAGSHSISAAYSGDSQFAAATSNPLTMDISQQATATAVSANPNPAVAGQTVTFKVQVAGSSGGGPVLPTGSVAFQNGSTVLGTAAIAANGSASFTTSFPSQGNQTVTANYTGDMNYAVSSTSIVEAILPAYLLSSSGNSTVTVTSGQSGSLALSLTPQNSFSGTVTLACTGLPVYATCSFAPSPSVPISGTAAQTVNLTIFTGMTTAALANPLETIKILPAGTLFLIGICSLRPSRLRRIRSTLLAVIGLLLMTSVLSACGGGGNSNSGPSAPTTPAGTYAITLTSTSGTAQQNLPITLVVK